MRQPTYAFPPSEASNVGGKIKNHAVSFPRRHIFPSHTDSLITRTPAIEQSHGSRAAPESKAIHQRFDRSSRAQREHQCCG